MKIAIRLFAVSLAVIGMTVVAAAAATGSRATAPPGPSVILLGTSDESAAHGWTPAESAAPALAAPTAVPADDVVRVGQVPYLAPNADVPEALRAPTGDIACPGKEPCGP